MGRTIKHAASAVDCGDLRSMLNSMMMNCCEVIGLDSEYLVGEIVGLETLNGVRFTDRQIVQAHNCAANDMVDAYTTNAAGNKDFEQAAHFEAMRPATRRRAQLNARFAK